MQLLIPSKCVCHPPSLPNLSKWFHIPLVIHTRNPEAILDSLLFLLATSNPLSSEKAMAPYSSTLAWRIPGTGEPGGLPSMGSLRVRHDWSDLAAAIHYLTKSFFKTYLKLPSLHIYCSVSCSVVSDSTTPWTATATLVQVITIYHLSWNLLQ